MSGKKVLIADDDRAIRMVLDRALSNAGYDVRATDNGSTLWQWIESGDGDIVITDVRMPDVNGLDLVPRIKQLRPNLKIIVMSAQSTLLTAIKAVERGAYEYVPKPFDLDELIAVLERAQGSAGPAALDENPAEEEKLPLIGRSPAMQEIYRTVARLMSTDLTVMINGESGTGKELVARALHDYGKRRSGSFVAINMAAIPRDLVEAELFGFEKGAFTGATSSGIGRFQQARGGTLFLDEIGDMPLDAQTRLLRVLQEGEFTTVGGRTAIRADARIIAATHRDLYDLIKRRQFREDLYYRLNVVPIRLPPLRERMGDVPDLVRHFLEATCPEGGVPKMIDKPALEALENYTWPGNVRELENMIQRISALYTESVIGVEIVRQEIEQTRSEPSENVEGADSLGAAVTRHLSAYFEAHRGALPSAGLHSRIVNEVEKPLIALTLNATRGNQVKAAQVLGLNRNTLRKKIRELDIEVVRSSRN